MVFLKPTFVSINSSGFYYWQRLSLHSYGLRLRLNQKHGMTSDKDGNPSGFSRSIATKNDKPIFPPPLH
jgi:hypothetical protein